MDKIVLYSLIFIVIGLSAFIVFDYVKDLKDSKANNEEIQKLKDDLIDARQTVVFTEPNVDSLQYIIEDYERIIYQKDRIIDQQYFRIKKYQKRYEDAKNTLSGVAPINDIDSLDNEFARLTEGN